MKHEAFMQLLVLYLKRIREIWALKAICYITHVPVSKKCAGNAMQELMNVIL